MVDEKIKILLLIKNKFFESILKNFFSEKLPDLVKLVDNQQEADIVIIGPNYLLSSQPEVFEIIEKKKSLLLDFDFEEDELIVLLHLFPFNGIIYKDMEVDKLKKCLQVVNKGEVWIRRSTFEKFIRNDLSVSSLTPKELHVIYYLLQGLTNKEIGRKLGITEQTVKHYINSILKKIKKRNRVDIILSFYRFKNLIALILKRESALAQT